MNFLEGGGGSYYCDYQQKKRCLQRISMNNIKAWIDSIDFVKFEPTNRLCLSLCLTIISL